MESRHLGGVVPPRQGQNLGALGERASRPFKSQSRGAGKARKAPSTYATAYCRSIENFAKVKSKRDTKVALRGQVPRGVSSDHVYSQAFRDAFNRT